MTRRIFALIPARAGSKGVVNKNVRNLGGYPLLAWSIAAGLRSRLIDRVVVSTDSEEYAQISRELGAEVPFLRPAAIANDRSTDYEFIKHAVDFFATESGEPDIIVHIRPTTPFRDPTLIDRAIESFLRIPEATALRSVHAMAESAYKTFELAPRGQLKRVAADTTALDAANNARQSFPETFIANGYVDVLSTNFIRKNALIHGDFVAPFLTPVSYEVDTEEDFEFLEYLLGRTPEHKSLLFD